MRAEHRVFTRTYDWAMVGQTELVWVFGAACANSLLLLAWAAAVRIENEHGCSQVLRRDQTPNANRAPIVVRAQTGLAASFSLPFLVVTQYPGQREVSDPVPLPRRSAST